VAHPCDGHPCDHCYTCDVLGVCCMTGQGRSHQYTSARASDPEARLRNAMLAEPDADTSLIRLIQIEGVEAHRNDRATSADGSPGTESADSPQRALPPAATQGDLPPASTQLFHDRKENHVSATRPFR